MLVDMPTVYRRDLETFSILPFMSVLLDILPIDLFIPSSTLQ